MNRIDIARLHPDPLIAWRLALDSLPARVVETP
jgi:hypothetical protein